MKQYKVYRYCIEEAPEGMSEESVYDLVAEQLATMDFDTFIQESGLLMAYISAEICTLPEKGVLEIEFPPLRCAYTSELLPEGHYNAVWEGREAKPITVVNQLYIRAPHHAHSPNRNLLEILIAPILFITPIEAINHVSTPTTPIAATDSLPSRPTQAMSVST